MASVLGNGQVPLPTHNTRALYSRLCGSTRSDQDGRATLNPRLVTPTAQGAGEGRSKDLHPPPCRHKRGEYTSTLYLATAPDRGAGEGKPYDLHPLPCRHKGGEQKLPPSTLWPPRRSRALGYVKLGRNQFSHTALPCPDTGSERLRRVSNCSARVATGPQVR